LRDATEVAVVKPVVDPVLERLRFGRDQQDREAGHRKHRAADASPLTPHQTTLVNRHQCSIASSQIFTGRAALILTFFFSLL
jgi:hypothetical protein